MFHGSYAKDDVIFLLRVLDIAETPIAQKEAMIQNRQHHYSEMISPEYRPDGQYLDMFYDALAQNLEKVTQHLLALAQYFATFENPVIVSLARAGTPVGVILKRMLAEFYHKDVAHYSISIIKGRGIDEVALLHIANSHPTGQIVFVDGWTSKGSINSELKSAVGQFNEKYDLKLDDALHVLSDISGNAEVTATHEDYLIPSAILNSIISGLVSRSIYNQQLMDDGGYHGCKYYGELATSDLSIWYVEQIMAKAHELRAENIAVIKGGDATLRSRFKSFIDQYAANNDIADTEMLKPGIGEATRALLRRVPKVVLVKDDTLPEVKHILHLCVQRNVPLEVDPLLPFKTMAVLTKL